MPTWKSRYLALLSLAGVALILAGIQVGRDSCPPPQPCTGTCSASVCSFVETPLVIALVWTGIALIPGGPALAALDWAIRRRRRPLAAEVPSS